MPQLKIDFTTEDSSTGEDVLYLVEVGPWDNLPTRLRAIEERVYLAIDAVLDGYLHLRVPISRCAAIRIQVDGHAAPMELDSLIERIDRHVNSHPDYVQAMGPGRAVQRLRIVTGRSIGRSI